MKSSDKQNQLRNEILQKVAEFHDLNEEVNQLFVPGESNITFAGRVYDKSEMVNLVDSSLDFWLTAGRYAQKFETDFAKFMGQKNCILVIQDHPSI